MQGLNFRILRFCLLALIMFEGTVLIYEIVEGPKQLERHAQLEVARTHSHEQILGIEAQFRSDVKALYGSLGVKAFILIIGAIGVILCESLGLIIFGIATIIEIFVTVVLPILDWGFVNIFTCVVLILEAMLAFWLSNVIRISKRPRGVFFRQGQVIRT